MPWGRTMALRPDGSPGHYLPPPPPPRHRPSSQCQSPDTLPAAICADLPLAVNDSGAGGGGGVGGGGVVLFTPVLQPGGRRRCADVIEAGKMAAVATARPTSALPVGAAEQHFASEPAGC